MDPKIKKNDNVISNKGNLIFANFKICNKETHQICRVCHRSFTFVFIVVSCFSKDKKYPVEGNSIMKVNDRFSKMEIFTFNKKYNGRFLVNKLKAVQNETVLTPKLPRTVPKGGEGSALCARKNNRLIYFGNNAILIIKAK